MHGAFQRIPPAACLNSHSHLGKYVNLDPKPLLLSCSKCTMTLCYWNTNMFPLTQQKKKNISLTVQISHADWGKDDWTSFLSSKSKLIYQIEFSQITMPQAFSMVQHQHPIVKDGSFTVFNKPQWKMSSPKRFCRSCEGCNSTSAWHLQCTRLLFCFIPGI